MILDSENDKNCFYFESSPGYCNEANCPLNIKGVILSDTNST